MSPRLPRLLTAATLTLAVLVPVAFAAGLWAAPAWPPAAPEHLNAERYHAYLREYDELRNALLGRQPNGPPGDG